MPHLRKEDYVVMPVHVSVAQELVKRYHYAKGGSLTGVYIHGLFRKDNPYECLGVAWWLPPTRDAALYVWPVNNEVIALSRLVVVPGMPTNSASFLLGQSIKLIKEGGRFRCLLTYADERMGHTGAIYKATNWEYLGMTQPKPVFIHKETGRQGITKSNKHRTFSEMNELGYDLVGYSRKHRFRMVLPPHRKKGVEQLLFTV